jgi:hypothetical protein
MVKKKVFEKTANKMTSGLKGYKFSEDVSLKIFWGGFLTFLIM